MIVPEVSEGHSAAVMSGVDCLLQEGYFYLVARHRHRVDLIDEYPRMFLEKSVDGIIAVDTTLAIKRRGAGCDGIGPSGRTRRYKQCCVLLTGG